METAKMFCVYNGFLRSVYSTFVNEAHGERNFAEVRESIEGKGFGLIENYRENASVIDALKGCFDTEYILLVEKSEISGSYLNDTRQLYIVGDTAKAVQLFTIIEKATNEPFKSADIITKRAQEAWKQVQGKDNKKENLGGGYENNERKQRQNVAKVGNAQCGHKEPIAQDNELV